MTAELNGDGSRAKVGSHREIRDAPNSENNDGYLMEETGSSRALQYVVDQT